MVGRALGKMNSDGSVQKNWSDYAKPLWQSARLIVRENGLFLGLVGLYCLVTYWINTPIVAKTVRPDAYLNYVQAVGGLGLVVIAGAYLQELICRFHSGFEGISLATRAVCRNYLRLDRLAGFLLFLGAVPFFFKAYNQNKFYIPRFGGFHWDQTWVELDLILHGGRHPWEWLQSSLSEPLMTVWIDKFYYHGWFMVSTFMFIWMAWSSNRIVRQRFYLTFLFSWTLGGTLLAVLFASAGPCYLGELYGGQFGYERLFLYLDEVHRGVELYALNGQAMLWENLKEESLLAGGGISAMPSMHVSMMTLCGLAAWQVNRLLGVVTALFAGIILVGSVHLGWHYAVDGYVSILLTWLLWRGAGALLQWRLSRSPSNASGTIDAAGRVTEKAD